MRRALPLLLLLLVAAAPPIRLPGTARELLKDGMRNHRSDIGALATAVVLLDHQQVARRAADLAAEPRLARPAPGDPALNAILPAAFFDLQDKLALDATELSKAAAKGDDAAMAKAYGRVAESCVGCHAMFRTPAVAP